MRCEIVHGVFAPTTLNALALRTLTRGRPSVQTLASLPAGETRIGEVVYADRVVVLSRAAEARALAEGVEAERLVRIRPAVSPPEAPSESRVLREMERLVLSRAAMRVGYVGDLEHGDGAQMLIDACAAEALVAEVVLVMATRAKTGSAQARQMALHGRARARRVRIVWAGTSPDIHALIAACDVVALPTNSLFAKVDHPLILLEAMHLGVPVIVTRGTSAYELAEEGGALGVDHDVGALVEQLVALRSSEARERAAARGRAFARSELSLDAMARAYGAVYDALLR